MSKSYQIVNKRDTKKIAEYLGKNHEVIPKMAETVGMSKSTAVSSSRKAARNLQN